MDALVNFQVESGFSQGFPCFALDVDAFKDKVSISRPLIALLTPIGYTVLLIGLIV